MTKCNRGMSTLRVIDLRTIVDDRATEAPTAPNQHRTASDLHASGMWMTLRGVQMYLLKPVVNFGIVRYCRVPLKHKCLQHWLKSDLRNDFGPQKGHCAHCYMKGFSGDP